MAKPPSFFYRQAQHLGAGFPVFGFYTHGATGLSHLL